MNQQVDVTPEVLVVGASGTLTTTLTVLGRCLLLYLHNTWKVLARPCWSSSAISWLLMIRWVQPLCQIRGTVHTIPSSDNYKSFFSHESGAFSQSESFNMLTDSPWILAQTCFWALNPWLYFDAVQIRLLLSEWQLLQFSAYNGLRTRECTLPRKGVRDDGGNHSWALKLNYIGIRPHVRTADHRWAEVWAERGWTTMGNALFTCML